MSAFERRRIRGIRFLAGGAVALASCAAPARMESSAAPLVAAAPASAAVQRAIRNAIDNDLHVENAIGGVPLYRDAAVRGARITIVVDASRYRRSSVLAGSEALDLARDVTLEAWRSWSAVPAGGLTVALDDERGHALASVANVHGHALRFASDGRSRLIALLDANQAGYGLSPEGMRLIVDLVREEAATNAPVADARAFGMAAGTVAATIAVDLANATPSADSDLRRDFGPHAFGLTSPSEQERGAGETLGDLVGQLRNGVSEAESGGKAGSRLDAQSAGMVDALTTEIRTAARRPRSGTELIRRVASTLDRRTSGASGGTPEGALDGVSGACSELLAENEPAQSEYRTGLQSATRWAVDDEREHGGDGPTSDPK
jgi:hypothetical protein